MRTGVFIVVCVILSFVACKSGTEPGPSYNFYPLSIGSHWSYKGDVSYTLTVIGDTLVNAKHYAVIEKSTDKTVSFLRRDGNSIYTLHPNLSNLLQEYLYVEGRSGAKGSYSYLTKGIVTNVTYSVDRFGIRDTVNGVNYPSVIVEHIRSVIQYKDTSFSITEGDYYFADGVGLINKLVSGDATVELLSYEIK